MSPDHPAFPYAFQHEEDARFVSSGFSPGISLLTYLIAHAPEVPNGHVIRGSQASSGGCFLISPAERQALWRMEYALAQIAAMNQLTTPPA